MFKKESNSKRGEVVGDALDLLSILFTVLVILLFLHLTFTSSGEAKAQQVAVSLAQSYAQQELLVLLQAPITVESTTVSLADFILLWDQGQSTYYDLFPQEVRKILGSVSESCVSLAVEPQQNDGTPRADGMRIDSPRVVITPRGTSCQHISTYATPTITLPAKEGVVKVTYQYPVRP